MSSSSSSIDYGVDVTIVPTSPFAGQKPGTSGLRKKVKEVCQPNYIENFIQSIFNSFEENAFNGKTLVVSGDGRYYNKVVINTLLRMCCVNGVSRVIVGGDGIMSTPCVSGVIRHRKCFGGFILTASHNPGGPTEDFGIKYNTQNGGPANEALTDKIFENTKNIKNYKIGKQNININYSEKGEYKYGNMIVEVINASSFYADRMEEIFDFKQLQNLFKRKDFSFVYDGMSGAGGPFAQEIFVKRLGAKQESLINCTPKEDFGGGHPDPNLTYAHELVELMGLSSSHSSASSDSKQLPDFGAASDGDADRNMILGKKFFVTPSDSVAIISAYAAECIPFFKNSGGLKGVARSMPTSAALDRVAKHLNIRCFEVPTGWKFFGNLMDSNQLSICGEESFGTGSDHVREKDGIWAILAWLSLIQYKNQSTTEGNLVTVEQIVKEHWKKFGRNYYSRYDYEGVESKQADQVFNHLLQVVGECNKAIQANNPLQWGSYKVTHSDEFTYHDPVDKSVSEHQGIRFHFHDGSRIIFRLSGTGSVGATIRIYFEKYENNENKLLGETQNELKEIIEIALKQSKIIEFTGREKPTVIT